jgi:hypothetical protein
MFAGQGVPPNLFLVMLLYFVGASLFMTWISEGTGGSLLLMVLAHVGAHLNNSHRALPAEVLPLVAHAIVYAGLGWLVMRKLGSDRGARPVRFQHLFRRVDVAPERRTVPLRGGLG